MIATHGLVDSFVHFAPPTKQQVLLFDTLIFPRFHLDDQFASKDDCAVLMRLEEKRIMRRLTLTEDDSEPWFGHDSEQDLALVFPRSGGDDPVAAAGNLRTALSQTHGIDAVPILRRKGDWNWANASPGPKSSADVVEIVLSALPTPAEDVSWDAILDFRSDPETRHKLLGLRRWMNTMASGNRSSNEICEEVEYLLGEYRKHLEFHRMKWRLGTLESILTVGAEALEGILRLTPTRLVSAMFGIKHRRIALQEAEFSAPGRELAYLIDAGNTLRPG